MTTLKYQTISYYNKNNSIQSFTVNNKNNLLAVCDDKAYYIDIIDLKNNKIMKTFKRGITVSEIINLDFSDDNLFLIVQNTKGTVHLFNIYETNFIYNPFNTSISKLYLTNIISYTRFLKDILIIIDIDGNIHYINFKNNELIIKNSIRFIKNKDELFDKREFLIE